MFPGDVKLDAVVREYLARDDYGSTVTDRAVGEFLKDIDFVDIDVLQVLVSIAYQKGAADASSMIGV